MLRLGFVGCGKWARKLAESFRACGAEIVAYDRGSGRHRARCPYSCDDGHEGPLRLDGMVSRCPQGCDAGWEYQDPDGFGSFMPWRGQLTDKSIDAIVAVAPPEVTTQVALEAASLGRPVMATKPLLRHPDNISAPWWVDLWRLDSPPYRAFFASLHKLPEEPVEITLCGNGPFRSFDGILDYGPHVAAALLQAANGAPIRLDSVSTERHGVGVTYVAIGSSGRLRFKITMGNGSEVPVRDLKLGKFSFALEDGIALGNTTKSFALERFCQHFLADVAEGTADPRWLKLSRESSVLLERIRSQAT